MFDFGVDIDNLIMIRLRKIKRTPKAVALLLSFAAGIKDIYISFNDKRILSLRRAKVFGTKIYLEKYLNETFVTQSIEIVNLNPEALLLCESSITDGFTPIYLNESLAPDDTIVGDLAYYANLSDFEVRISASEYPSIDKSRLRAMLSEYIFSGINYKVEIK